MSVRPVLGEWEIPRIARIRTLEQRAFVEMPVPGRVGSLFQDLDSAPVAIEIAGSLYGDEARDSFLEELRGRFQAGEPVTFVADITTATRVEYVVVEELVLEQSSERPEETVYRVRLRESPPPPPPPDPLGGLDAGLLDQAEGFLDSVSGALDVIDSLASVPEISDPTTPLRGALDGVRSAVDGLGSIGATLGGLFGEDG